MTKDIQVVKESKYFNAIWFRLDKFGIYLWTTRDGVVPGITIGCISIQWPWVNAPHHAKGMFFDVFDFEQSQAYWRARYGL